MSVARWIDKQLRYEPSPDEASSHAHIEAAFSNLLTGSNTAESLIENHINDQLLVVFSEAAIARNLFEPARTAVDRYFQLHTAEDQVRQPWSTRDPP